MRNFYIFLFLGLLPFFDCESARKTSKPKFGKLSGIVYINGQKAKQHHYIPLNTEVEAVGKNSYFEVKLGNGNLIRVVGGKIILKKGERNNIDRVALLKGRFYASIKKQSKKNFFKLRMKDISIEGKGLFMAVHSTSSIYVSKGEMEVLDNQKNKYLVKAGEIFNTTPPKEQDPSTWVQGPREAEVHIKVKAQQILDKMIL